MNHALENHNCDFLYHNCDFLVVAVAPLTFYNILWLTRIRG